MQKSIWSHNEVFVLNLFMLLFISTSASFQYSCSQYNLWEYCSYDSLGNNCGYGGCCLKMTIYFANLTKVVSICGSCLMPTITTTFTRYGTDSLGDNCDCVLTVQYEAIVSVVKFCVNQCCGSDTSGVSSNSSDNIGAIIGGIIGGVVGLSLLIIIIYCLYIKKKSIKFKQTHTNMKIILQMHVKYLH